MSDRAPRFPERYRMPARIACVLAAYGIYRLAVDKRMVAAIFLGFGSLILMWTAVDRLTLARKERLDLMQAGSLVLGIGLLVVGAIQL